jgi:hypothetical protein
MKSFSLILTIIFSLTQNFAFATPKSYEDRVDKEAVERLFNESKSVLADLEQNNPSSYQRIVEKNKELTLKWQNKQNKEDIKNEIASLFDYIGNSESDFYSLSKFEQDVVVSDLAMGLIRAEDFSGLKTDIHQSLFGPGAPLYGKNLIGIEAETAGAGGFGAIVILGAGYVAYTTSDPAIRTIAIVTIVLMFVGLAADGGHSNPRYSRYR